MKLSIRNKVLIIKIFNQNKCFNKNKVLYEIFNKKKAF